MKYDQRNIFIIFIIKLYLLMYEFFDISLYLILLFISNKNTRKKRSYVATQ